MTTVNDLLAAARPRLDRPDPPRAAEMVRNGAILVATPPGREREQAGGLPGALVI